MNTLGGENHDEDLSRQRDPEAACLKDNTLPETSETDNTVLNVKTDGECSIGEDTTQS